jgi:hypothetical protein
MYVEEKDYMKHTEAMLIKVLEGFGYTVKIHEEKSPNKHYTLDYRGVFLVTVHPNIVQYNLDETVHGIDHYFDEAETILALAELLRTRGGFYDE